MTGLPLNRSAGGGRFPRFDVMGQARHWDDSTRTVVEARLQEPTRARFFTLEEQATANALFDQLLDQRCEPKVPVMQMVDERLFNRRTDGWHYSSMPIDEVSWRTSLKGLDLDATERCGHGFTACGWDAQSKILDAIHHLDARRWRGLVAAQVWSLWTRYACTAFYSHPWAWNEIGFGGPAYPRGYKNLGVNKLEPFEQRDSRPGEDPVIGDTP